MINLDKKHLEGLYNAYKLITDYDEEGYKIEQDEIKQDKLQNNPIILYNIIINYNK